MPSYTSSSDANVLPGIVVPEQPWGRVAILMVGLLVLALGAWELRVRSLGYAPSFDDTPLLWGMSHDRMKALEAPVVLVGDSRMRFGIDHDILEETFPGREVVSLAINGSVGRPVLEMLAKDPTFKGTVLMSYTPALFWAPGGPGLQTSLEWMEKHAKRTPAARWGQVLWLLPDACLAFLEKEDLSLASMLRRTISLPNRPGVRLPPRLPPYLCDVHLDRREVMWHRLETDGAFQQEIQGIWKVLFSFAQPLPPDLLAKLRAEVIADVRSIEARGGRVIFIALPSSGWLEEYEESIAPKATHWEPLIAESGCLGIHYRDHEALRNFVCPEWSHLTAADAVAFTRGVAEILKRQGVNP